MLRDPSARARARHNGRMIADYRGDGGALRAAASLGGAAVDVLGHPQRAVERMREAILPDLPAGEPTRRDSHVRGEALPRRNSANMAAPRDDMRDDRHPAHDKYRQAYAGVEKIDRALGRESDGNSEDRKSTRLNSSH